MPVKCKDLTDIIEDMAPLCLGAKFDNIGLLVGSKEEMINSVLVALDVNDAVLSEAIETGSNLIVTHHPVIFNPLKSVTQEDFKGRLIHKLIGHNINVYSAHTNLDSAENGINDFLAKGIGLHNTSVLEKTYEKKYDIYPLLNGSSDLGFGRVGYLETEVSLSKLCDMVKNMLGIDEVNVVGDLNKPVIKVGLCSGDGSDFIGAAKNAGCDVYITGDVRYHDACDARDMGIALIDAGHFATENIYMTELYEILNNAAEKKGLNINIYLSKKNRSPFIKV